MSSQRRLEPYSYRSDPSVPPFADDRPVIVFDGHCVLCSRFARFVIAHDPQRRFRLTAAQGRVGQALYRHYGLDPVQFETNLLVEDGHGWFKSEGTIRMFVGLGAPWSVARVLRVVPSAWLDRLYEFVARNRLRWFGSTAQCFVPSAADRERFVE
jgi:predicted DCC family thiol-disulfide oxidoreductase YuxK